MSDSLAKETKKAIVTELKLQDCYRDMSAKAKNPRVKAVLHDLLLMEEMNEVLLRSLNHSLGH